MKKNSLLIGIFVGGKSSRMGGLPKGLLPAPEGSESLLARAVRISAEALPDARRVLVGNASAYAGLGCPALTDEPADIGPLGGLRALLLEALRLESSHAVALSCDLPRFTAELLRRLASEEPDALALSPREDERWQPFFARYASRPALTAVEQALAAGDRSLQRVLARLAPAELALSPAERAELIDWDCPEDIQT